MVSGAVSAVQLMAVMVPSGKCVGQCPRAADGC